jgi:hypothetical protein
MKAKQIAIACHNAHNVLCKYNDMKVTPWEEKSKEHRKIVENSVKKILKGKIGSPEEAHENFLAKKEAKGWSYADKYSEREMTNPRLCNWEELSAFDRQFEEMFFAVANSFNKNS